MNLIASIFIFLFSLFSSTNEPVSGNVQGVWKGYYGTEREVKEITIFINEQNKAELYGSIAHSNVKINGTYQLLGDSAIIISSKLPESTSAEIILIGNLNRSASFISGDWDEAGSERGCFYLQKQLGKSNL